MVVVAVPEHLRPLLSRKTMRRVGIAAVGLSVLALAWPRPRRPKGRPTPAPTVGTGRFACPPYQSPAGVKTGDFVVLTLESDDKTFSEATWARVLSVNPSRTRAHVQLSGVLGQTAARPLETSRHGFRLAQKAFVGLDCVWDVLRPPPADRGQILCGLFAQQVRGDDGPVATPGLKPGDEILVHVATRTAEWTVLNEELWARVGRISQTGTVIGATVVTIPKVPHTFKVGDELELGRDCIFGWRPL